MIEVADAQVRYRAGDQPALRGASLTVRPGAIVSLVGANGSGKSTLASLLCGMRLADGGTVSVDGFDPAHDPRERREVRRLVGLVRQHPYDQLVSSVVFDEVAFGPRNLGLGSDEVRRRVTEALACVGLAGTEERDTSALSGGQQQLLAIAGVLAMHPSYLVLDEASSMLDSSARPAHRALVERLAHGLGVGVVQVTHDPLEVLASDEVVVLDRGTIVFSGAPRDLLVDESGLWDRTVLPSAPVQVLRAALRLGFACDGTATPEDAAAWLIEAFEEGTVDRARLERVAALLRPNRVLDASSAGDAAQGLELRGVSYAYEAPDPVLDGVDLAVAPGEVLLVAGRSGSGKSTLAALAAGLYQPDSGAVRIGGSAPTPGRVGVTFQRPEDQLFCESVADELAFAPRNMGCTADETERRVRRAVELVGLDGALLDRYPFDLSGGQARRVAIASVLALDAAAYLFDEPTAGLDAAGRAQMHELARTCAADGRAVVVISHDLDEWLAEVDRVALIDAGRVAWQGAPGALRRAPQMFEGAGLRAPLSCRLSCMLDRVLETGGRP